jgi:predicted phosphodiesterase
MPGAGGDHTLLLSDVHGHYHVVEAQIEHARQLLGAAVARAVVAGDFGLFGPDLHAYFRRTGRRFAVPVAYVEGNHEDYRDFAALARQYADVAEHLERASVRQLGPWRALCLGGARYMDAWSTPRGCEITDQDIAACLARPAGSVDLVITHDCPCGIGVPNSPGLEHYGEPGVPGLERIAAHLKPRLWFFGHHHRWHDHESNGTRYIGLAESWRGYCLLDGDGRVRRVEHEVALPVRPAWYRLFGLR